MAKLHKLKLVNKLFPKTTSPEELSRHHTVFFDRHQAVNSKDQIQQVDYESENEEQRQEASFSRFVEKIKKTLPEIEELEPNFYEYGIDTLSMSLRMRTVEATEHYMGNLNFSQFDIVKNMVQHLDLPE